MCDINTWLSDRDQYHISLHARYVWICWPCFTQRANLCHTCRPSQKTNQNEYRFCELKFVSESVEQRDAARVALGLQRAHKRLSHAHTWVRVLISARKPQILTAVRTMSDDVPNASTTNARSSSITCATRSNSWSAVLRTRVNINI
jgi:hypothetical protein